MPGFTRFMPGGVKEAFSMASFRPISHSPFTFGVKSALTRAGIGAGVGALSGLVGAGVSGGDYIQGALAGAAVGAGIGVGLRTKTLKPGYEMLRGSMGYHGARSAIRAAPYAAIGVGSGIIGGMALSGHRNSSQSRGFNGGRGNRISSRGF